MINVAAGFLGNLDLNTKQTLKMRSDEIIIAFVVFNQDFAQKRMVCQNPSSQLRVH